MSFNTHSAQNDDHSQSLETEKVLQDNEPAGSRDSEQPRVAIDAQVNNKSTTETLPQQHNQLSGGVQDASKGREEESIDSENDVHGLSEEFQRLNDSRGRSREPRNNAEDTATKGASDSKPTNADGEGNVSYLDPTPKTPRTSNTPSRAHSFGPTSSGSNLDETADGVETFGVLPTGPNNRGDIGDGRDTGDDPDDDAKSEIQSIIDQFEEKEETTGEGESFIPEDELRSPHIPTPSNFPPRKSSLEPLVSISSESGPPVPEKEDSYGSHAYDHSRQLQMQDHERKFEKLPSRSSSLQQPIKRSSVLGDGPQSPQSAFQSNQSLPPEPDPEPDLPFDFHRFLEQLRHRTADPVAKFLRSFLVEFSKKQWMSHEQVKIVSDFLAFIANKMSQCEVWRGVSDAEFDNAREGMEKLVMNRLYSQTFSPAIPPPTPIPGGKGKRKNMEKLLGPGRKGQHQEDVERDEILNQKVQIYGWVCEEHLDISPVGDSGSRFLTLAQQELLKIKTYRAPRDKVICVLNCCKVIFGLLRNAKSGDTSADAFVPLLILVVLRAKPDHLVSNVQYILRFRNQDKLGGEAGYYLSSLMGAIQFIENLDRTTLTISDDLFEKNVEAAVSTIAERHKDEMPQPVYYPTVSEKSGLSEPEVVPRNSTEIEYSTPRRSNSFRRLDSSAGSGSTEEGTAVKGLLRTIQRPLSSIGKMFSDDSSTAQSRSNANRLGPPVHQNQVRPLSPAVFQPPRHSTESRRSDELPSKGESTQQAPSRRLGAEDAAARQASAEAAEAQKIQQAEHANVVATLSTMFPGLDKDVIDDVVRVKQGRVGLAVDACLALSS